MAKAPVGKEWHVFQSERVGGKLTVQYLFEIISGTLRFPARDMPAPDHDPFTGIMQEMVADLRQDPDIGKCLIAILKTGLAGNGEDGLVLGEHRRPVEIFGIPPLPPDRSEQRPVLFIKSGILLVRCIGMELVHGGFQEGDGREDRAEGEGLVPELGIGLEGSALKVFLLDCIRETAEDGGGLDITDGEAVPETDRGVLTLYLDGDLIHLYYPVLFVR